jgi:hypothetical protein
MANVTLSINLQLNAPPVSDNVNSGTVALTSSGATSTKSFPTIPTSSGGTALNFGGITPGLIYVRNLDPTNYVQIMTAVSGTVILKLMPGEAQLLRFDPGITAPAAIAHTAPVQIELFAVAN